MLRVLRHYLPIRKAALILSETLLLSLVLGAGMTLHLWSPSREVLHALILENMNPETAFLRCSISAMLLAVLAQVAIAFNELYDFRISSSRYDRSSRFVESAGSALGLTLVVVVLLHTWELKRVLDFPGLSLSQRVQTLVFSLLLCFGLLHLWRNLFHYLLRRISLNERVLILGSGQAAHALALEMLERPDSGYEVIGLIPDRGPEGALAERRSGTAGAGAEARSLRPAAGEKPSWGGWTRESDAPAISPTTQALVLEHAPQLAMRVASEATESRGNGAGESETQEPEGLFDLVQRMQVDLIAVALQDRRSRLPTDELLRCRLAGIPVREQEAIYEQITGKMAVQALRPSYLIFNEGFRVHPWAELAKRGVDVVSAALILAVSWPLMLAAAIAIRIDSPGPILFNQERVGRDGKPFTLFKFRSMRADAEKQTGPVWATEDDPRITRCGRFLRRSRIDELPQLFNVLSGNMSLVGPRPERPHFVEDLTERIPYYGQRHIVKPGVTGWAQINYPYGNTFEDALNKLQFDLFYIKNQSLLFDLSILFNTIKTVVLRKGT